MANFWLFHKISPNFHIRTELGEFGNMEFGMFNPTNMSYQMATMHEHVYTRGEFEMMGARSPAALCWLTGVLLTVHQLQGALSIASDGFLHSGAVIVHAHLLSTGVVQDVLAAGWLASGVFRLRLQRVWKRVWAPSVQKVRVCVLHQWPGELP